MFVALNTHAYKIIALGFWLEQGCYRSQKREGVSKCQIIIIKILKMHQIQPSNSSKGNSNNFLHSLKLKYTGSKSGKAADHQAFLNAYASLRPNNDHSTDRYKVTKRSPLKNDENCYQNNAINYANYRKSIVDLAYYDTEKAYALRDRSNNLSLQRKPSFVTIKYNPGERSLPKFKESARIVRPEYSIRRESTTAYDQRVTKQTRRDQKEGMKQWDSPIKLIYDSNQNEQQLVALPLRAQPKAKSNQIEHYYKLQRQKTTKTISNIQNILASIRNTLNK